MPLRVFHFCSLSLVALMFRFSGVRCFLGVTATSGFKESVAVFGGARKAKPKQILKNRCRGVGVQLSSFFWLFFQWWSVSHYVDKETVAQEIVKRMEFLAKINADGAESGQPKFVRSLPGQNRQLFLVQNAVPRSAVCYWAYGMMP